MKIKLYTTPTCGTCKMAAKRLESKAVDLEVIDLTEHPDLLDNLKRRLDKGPAEQIQVPIFEDESGELFNITGLPELEARASV